MSDPIHYYAGGNTRLLAEALIGQPILWSYADTLRRPGVWAQVRDQLTAGLHPRAMLDSGAFTELSEAQRGVANPLHVYADLYATFCRRHGHLFDQIVTLDDIGGDIETTWRNTETLEAYGVSVVPVYHGNEPWSVLEHYADKYDHVAIGFRRVSGRIAATQGPEDSSAIEWAAECARRVEGRATVHGFGMTRFQRTLGLAVDTTDSTTWTAELCSLSRVRDCAEPWVRSMSTEERAQLVIASYSGSGGYSPRASGQAATVLGRFSCAEVASFRSAH